MGDCFQQVLVAHSQKGWAFFPLFFAHLFLNVSIFHLLDTKTNPTTEKEIDFTRCFWVRDYFRKWIKPTNDSGLINVFTDAYKTKDNIHFVSRIYNRLKIILLSKYMRMIGTIFGKVRLKDFQLIILTNIQLEEHNKI